MRLTTRQTGVISYAGLDEQALWEGARRAFAQADPPVPERFRSFLPVFPLELIVNMPYLGKAGFSRDMDDYHRQLSEECPDLYAGFNRSRCFKGDEFIGGAVTVDEVWVRRFPQYQPFAGEKLCLYLIGGGHQGVAVPESIYPLGGGILHNAERELGVTARCRHFTAYLEQRLKMGDAYDALRFEEEYLALHQLSTLAISQKTLGRMMQDMAIVRELNQPEQQTELFTAEGKSAEDIAQYVPGRYACDFFEEEPVTRQTARLMQLYFEGDDFQSNLWLPWQDASQYLNRKNKTLDVRALCDGFQIAPATDADTRGGCYPNRVRLVTVVDRSLRLMVAQTLNNPAYGSGMNPMGMLNKLVFLKNSRELIAKGQLTVESHTIACANTRVSEDELLRMRALAQWQENKGRLIDAMYRRESALSQMQPGSLAYERAKDVLDAKVERLQTLVRQSPVTCAQRSGYDGDIAYLTKLSQSREGIRVMDADPQREKCVETGFAMRARARTVNLSDVYRKPGREAPPPKKEPPRRQQAANGQWFEQMDFLAAIPKDDEE